MRIAVTLGGSDRGLSGIGTYVRSILPHLIARARAEGGSVVALGTPSELAAYPIAGLDRDELPSALDAPIASALWHLTSAGARARRAGADVLLLPAANRRMTLRSPLPTVAVVHDLAQLHVPKKYDPLRMLYVRRALTPSLRGATELVAVSHATRGDLVRALNLSRDRVHVVPNGVDALRFSPASAADDAPKRSMEAMKLTTPYILYTARLEHPGKNHMRLLRAYASSRARGAAVLALAGNDWGALPALRAEAERLGVSDRVRFLGFVPDALLPGLVAGASAVLMVGLHEGFGLPALEALASGRPVVASRAGALPEVTGGLDASCDPLSEASIAAALDRALFDEALRARARLEGPRWASQFTWEATSDGLLRLLSRSAAAREPRSSSSAPAPSARPSDPLLPRARARDVLFGSAPLVGSRLDPRAPRGLISPIEGRVHMGIPYGDLAAEEGEILRRRSAAALASIVARALIASALAPSPEAPSPSSPVIVSARLNNVTIAEAIEHIFEEPERLGRGRAKLVHFVHPHALNLAAFDATLAEALADADLVLPDGVGIRVAAALLGVAMRHNLNGTDLLPLLCRRAADDGVPLALVGAAQGVADACAEELRRATPGLSIALTSHGFLDEASAVGVARELRALGRVIVLVGMGTPLQEAFSRRYLADLPSATVLTVGGLFDFYSGQRPRAPMALRELGLEWLFRLANDPRRLAKRYLLGNPLFLLLALQQKLAGEVYIRERWSPRAEA